MDNQLGPDLLSDLPVIENILVFLPIEDAIRTSILSTKWRYKWVGLPHLVFDVDGIFSSIENSVGYPLLNNFVTRTLFRHKGPIHKFKLDFPFMDSCPNTYELLLFLSKKDIKELILRIVVRELEFLPVPSCLYSCRNLTHLELYRCEFSPPPPTFKGFLFLTTLIVECVAAPSGTIESLVANSPLLENLECTNIGVPELRISAPNLKYFFLGSTYKKIHLCTPLLDKMTVKFDDEIKYKDELLHRKTSVCNYTDFLGGFTNLERLTGDSIFTRFLSIGIEYCHHPLAFHHLKVITLNVNFQDANVISVVVRLLMDAVNLQELRIKCDSFYEYQAKAPHMYFWDFECPQNCMFKKLKSISMTDLYGVLDEMKFIIFLLKCSPVLETVNVDARGFGTDQNMLNSIDELLAYFRASTSAKILFEK